MGSAQLTVMRQACPPRVALRMKRHPVGVQHPYSTCGASDFFRVSDIQLLISATRDQTETMLRRQVTLLEAVKLHDERGRLQALDRTLCRVIFQDPAKKCAPTSAWTPTQAVSTAPAGGTAEPAPQRDPQAHDLNAVYGWSSTNGRPWDSEGGPVVIRSGWGWGAAVHA